MKTIFLSAFLLCVICTLATAQRKMQFGVTIQSGNYLQARHEQKNYDYQSNDYRLMPGILAGLGVFAERTLGSHVGLYGGLNFFQSSFTERQTKTDFNAERALNGGVYQESFRYTVRQLVLPVRLQFSYGKHRQVDFSIGVAPAIAVAKLNPDQQIVRYQYASLICGDGSYSYLDSEDPNLKFQVLTTAGLHYRPDTHNAIGLEYWLAPKAKDVDSLPYYRYGYTPNFSGQNYRMRSLQVSLRHSW